MVFMNTLRELLTLLIYFNGVREYASRFHIHTGVPFCQGHPTVLLCKLSDNVNAYLLHLKENKRP